MANFRKRYNLFDDFLQLNILLLDYLRKQSVKKDSPLHQCKAKNVGVLHKFLFGTQFSAHVAEQHVLALISILFCSIIQLTTPEVQITATTMKALDSKHSNTAPNKVLIEQFKGVPISTGIAKRILEQQLTYEILEDTYKQKHVRGMLIVLALPAYFTNDIKGKPRVTNQNNEGNNSYFETFVLVY